MKTMMRLVVLGLLGSGALYADLVTPPTIDSVSVPSSALVGQSVTVSATVTTNLSDDSDGNDWNNGGSGSSQLYAINIFVLPT